MERERLGISTLSTLSSLNPPPFASIPTKRTYEDSDSNHNFDLSEIDDLLGVPKAKRTRLSVYDEGWERFGQIQSADTKG